MTFNDIVDLARAGFTAAQIAALAAAPTVQQPAPTVQQPAPVVQQPAPVVQQPAPVVQQPAPVVQQPAPVVQQPAPVVQQPAPAGVEALLAEMRTLTQSVQSSNMFSAQQPAARTVEDICAEIINPPAKGGAANA